MMQNVSGSWFIRIVFFIVLLVFALFGVYGYFGSNSLNSNNEIAKVNGNIITIQEFDRSFQAEAANSPEVSPQSVLDSLINAALIQDFMNSLKLVAAEKEVIRQITSNQTFFTDNRFDQRKYNSTLQNFNISPQEYEKQLSKDLQIDAFRILINTISQASEKESKQQVDALKKTLTLKMATINSELFAEKINPTEQELQDFYNREAVRYTSNKKYDLEYFIVYASQTLSGDEEVSDQQIQRYYQQNIDMFTSQDYFDSAHILISTSKNSDQAAFEKANDIYNQLLENPDKFNDLAKEYSDDPSVSYNNGELGPANFGDFDKDYEAAIRTLEPGVISAPVKTQFGYHIIKLNKIENAQVAPLSRVRVLIEQNILDEQAQNNLQAIIDSNQQNWSVQTFEELAKTFNRTSFQTVTFDGTALDNITNYSDLYQELSTKQANDVNAWQNNNKLLVYKIQDVIEPALQPFTEIEDRVKSDYIQEQANTDLNRSLANYLNKDLEVSELEDYLKSINADSQQQEIEVFGYDQNIPNIGYNTKIHQEIMALGPNKKAIILPKDDKNEEFFAFQFVSQGTSDNDALDMEETNKQLSNFYQEYFYSLILNKLRTEASIDINQNLLSQYTDSVASR